MEGMIRNRDISLVLYIINKSFSMTIKIDTNRDLDLKLHFSIRSLKESTTDILIDRILESVRYDF